jgi:two-component system OmpR family response regulator
MVDNIIKNQIFIVENDVIQLTVLEKKLKELNLVNFTSFITSVECLENLDLKPEIILSDYYLEGNVTAVDLLKKVKEKLPETKFIFMTASESPEIAKDAYENGAFEFLVKGESTFYLRIKNVINKIFECKKLLNELKELKG